MTMPACAIDHCTRPEQSNCVGPAPPQTYGVPSRLFAAARNLATSSGVRPRPWPTPTSAAPAAPVVTVVVPTTTWVTSGATAVPAGASLLILAISRPSLVCGALTTIAFADGRPSDRATASETTASTPPMPTVPNPATGS